MASEADYSYWPEGAVSGEEYDFLSPLIVNMFSSNSSWGSFGVCECGALLVTCDLCGHHCCEKECEGKHPCDDLLLANTLSEPEAYRGVSIRTFSTGLGLANEDLTRGT
jgi:hypothetical protein